MTRIWAHKPEVAFFNWTHFVQNSAVVCPIFFVFTAHNKDVKFSLHCCLYHGAFLDSSSFYNQDLDIILTVQRLSTALFEEVLENFLIRFWVTDFNAWITNDLAELLAKFLANKWI